MVHSAKETEAGTLTADCVDVWQRNINDYSAVLVGPGMTVNEDTKGLVKRILDECRVPLIMDADALNVCSGCTDMIRNASCPVLITPHPGEMAGLLNCSTADVQADRTGKAVSAMEAAGAVVVLKGAGTIIAAEDRGISINMTGNPGMACGGMGDVLAGLVTGLAAQGIDLFDAACTAVYCHGRAGDLAAGYGSQSGMTAGDVQKMIPHAFREIAGR
jgi:NAD(P)H-hydrate epimerase